MALTAFNKKKRLLVAIILLLAANAFHYGYDFEDSSMVPVTEGRPLKAVALTELSILPAWLIFSANSFEQPVNLFAVNRPPEVITPIEVPKTVLQKEPQPVVGSAAEMANASHNEVEVLAVNIDKTHASCMLKFAGDVYVVGEGETVGNQYRVERITASLVYLTRL